MTSVQMLGSGASGRSRWGGEFEFRSFDTKVQGVNNVDVDSFVLRAMWQATRTAALLDQAVARVTTAAGMLPLPVPLKAAPHATSPAAITLSRE